MANQYNNYPLLGYKVISTNKEISVWWIQQKLNRIYPDQHIAEDNKFGEETLNLIRRFQKDERLPVDGIVGKDTYDALMKADPWMGKKVDSPILKQTNGILPREPKFRLDKIFFSAILQSIFSTETFESMEKFLGKKDWSGLILFINHKITADLRANDPEILKMQREINDAYNRQNTPYTPKPGKNNLDNVKYSKHYNKHLIQNNQSKIDLKINLKLWNPEKLFQKIEPLCKMLKTGVKVCSYFEAIQIATEWIWHYFPYEHERSQTWINESATIQSRLIDCLIKGLVSQLAMAAVAVAIGTVVSGGWAVVLTILVGIIVGILIELISNFIGHILTGDSSLTGCETIVYIINKQSQPFLSWANSK